jgi:hydroxyacylglutathione hydrolase
MLIKTLGSMKIHCLPDGPIQANTWLIDTGTATCLIDPILSPRRLPPQMSPVRWLLATHGHIDHIGQADAWRDLTGAPLMIHFVEQAALTDASVNLSSMMGQGDTFRPADGLIDDNWQLQLSPDLHLVALHTPGHTAGSVCFLLMKNDEALALFTGDTLFAGSIGRVDLGGDEAAMRKSLARLAQLARMYGPDLPVYPGHGPATTLGQELASNPWLQFV